jgi:hypothetical protein
VSFFAARSVCPRIMMGASVGDPGGCEHAEVDQAVVVFSWSDRDQG